MPQPATHRLVGLSGDQKSPQDQNGLGNHALSSQRTGSMVIAEQVGEHQRAAPLFKRNDFQSNAESSDRSSNDNRHFGCQRGTAIDTATRNNHDHHDPPPQTQPDVHPSSKTPTTTPTPPPTQLGGTSRSALSQLGWSSQIGAIYKMRTEV